MSQRNPGAFLQLCAWLVLLAALPASTSASSMPSGLSVPCVVIVPQGQVPAVSAAGHGKSMTPRIPTFRERLRALRALRTVLRTVEDEGKADLLAKRSLTFGIIAMSALLFLWLPSVGIILALGCVPMGILAIVNGLKARHLGSEKSAGLVLGIVSVSLFVMLMLLVLMFAVGLLVLMG